jgi:hypothetical protein
VFEPVAALHTLMAQNGDGNVPIWFTEIGWADHTNPAGTPNWQLGVKPHPAGRRPRPDAALGRPERAVRGRDVLVRSHQRVRHRHPNANYELLTTILTPKPDYTILQQYLDQ